MLMLWGKIPMAKKTKKSEILCLKNHEGYADPTAYEAIKKAEKEELYESDRFYNFLDAIFYIAELADFQFEGRLVVKDKKTGRIWR